MSGSEKNPSRCREIRGSIDETKTAIREVNRKKQLERDDLLTSRNEARATEKEIRRLKAMQTGADAASNSRNGILSPAGTFLSIQLAVKISNLEARWKQQKGAILSLKSAIKIKQQAVDRYRYELGKLSARGKALACVL